MKNLLKAVLLMIVTGATIISCDKSCEGCPEAKGGLLPTIFININDSSFSPSSVTAVNGRSFTFVNNTGAAKGIYSTDSIVINQPAIANTSSFFFKKDTVGTISYFMAGKPTVRGSITLTP